MKTIAEFIEAEGLTMTLDDDPNRAGRSWICTIRKGAPSAHEVMPGDGCARAMQTPFFQGSAHTEPPTLADVLDCLAMDSASYDDAADLLDWCSELGFSMGEDYERNKARETYAQVGELRDRLFELLGAAAYERLLWETESE